MTYRVLKNLRTTTALHFCANICKDRKQHSLPIHPRWKFSKWQSQTPIQAITLSKLLNTLPTLFNPNSNYPLPVIATQSSEMCKDWKQHCYS